MVRLPTIASVRQDSCCHHPVVEVTTRRPRWRRLLLVHTVLVLTLSVLVAAGMVVASQDTNLELGAVAVTVGGVLLVTFTALGLPWSLLTLYPVPLEALGTPDSAAVWMVVVFAPALVNLAIHAAVFTVVARQAAAAPPTPRNT